MAKRRKMNAIEANQVLRSASLEVMRLANDIFMLGHLTARQLEIAEFHARTALEIEKIRLALCEAALEIKLASKRRGLRT